MCCLDNPTNTNPAMFVLSCNASVRASFCAKSNKRPEQCDGYRTPSRVANKAEATASMGVKILPT